MAELTLAALGSAMLLGAVLLWSMAADRRRQRLQERLKAVIATTQSAEEPLPTLTLRRRVRGFGAGGWRELPSALWHWTEAEFAAAGNRIGPVQLIAFGCVGGLATFALLVQIMGLASAAALPAAAVAAGAAALLVLRLAQSRYRDRFLDLFPEALDLIARAVRAGLPVNEAMVVAAREVADPVGIEFQRTLDQMQLGVEAQDALQQTADRIRVPDFRFYVVALALQRRTGGSLAETLGNLSSIIRARKALRQKARALSSESKASAFILGILPFMVGGGLYLIAHDLMSVMFTDPRGRLMLGICLVDLLIGIGVMSWLIKWSLR